MSVRRRCAELLKYCNPFAANLAPPPQDDALPAAKKPRLEASTSISTAEDADVDTDTDIFEDAQTYRYMADDTLTASPDDAAAAAPKYTVAVAATSLSRAGAFHARKPPQNCSAYIPSTTMVGGTLPFASSPALQNKANGPERRPTIPSGIDKSIFKATISKTMFPSINMQIGVQNSNDNAQRIERNRLMDYTDQIVVTDNDVIFGRGSKKSQHPGNKRLRHMALKYSSFYQAALKKEKPLINLLLVYLVKSTKPSGR
jgi:hypothetical protein